MKTITKVAVWVLQFVYKYSGLRAIVWAVESFVLRYRLRVRMVPTSYKLFLVMVGAVGAYGWNNAIILYNGQQAEVWTFEQTMRIDEVEAKTEVIEKKPERDLADYIWMKESTRGKKNYSKCEAIGKVNGIGYRIPGNGDYVCFESHEDEMIVLNGWIIDKKALGWSELKMLCTYSGSNYEECKK